MSKRYDAIGLLSPEAIRSLVNAGLWQELWRIHDEIGRTLYALKLRPKRASIMSSVRLKAARMLVEFVRTPIANPKAGTLGIQVYNIQQWTWSELAKLGHKEAAPIARKWLVDSRRSVRGEGARALANLAHPADVGTIIKLVGDKDDYVAKEAVWGIGLALEAGSYSAPSRRRLVRCLQAVVSGKGIRRKDREAEMYSASTDTLLEVEGVEAARFLTSRSCIRASNPALRRVLCGLLSAMRTPKASYRKLLKRVADVDAIWSVYEQWQAGTVLISRKRVWWGCDDDQIAGNLLHLAAMCDPKRARVEVAKYDGIHFDENEFFPDSLEAARKLLRMPRKR